MTGRLQLSSTRVQNKKLLRKPKKLNSTSKLTTRIRLTCIWLIRVRTRRSKTSESTESVCMPCYLKLKQDKTSQTFLLGKTSLIKVSRLLWKRNTMTTKLANLMSNRSKLKTSSRKKSLKMLSMSSLRRKSRGSQNITRNTAMCLKKRLAKSSGQKMCMCHTRRR